VAETLGSLSDKLITVGLKRWHTEDKARLESLERQSAQLAQEIDEYVGRAVAGGVPLDVVCFPANKVYKKEGNEVTIPLGSIGGMIAELASVNCKLWHVQEKVYEIETVPPDKKDQVIRDLAVLNLQRNMCIDAIDKQLHDLLQTAAR
jgi:hypothetical protein